MADELSLVSGELPNRELQDSDLAEKWLRDVLNTMTSNVASDGLPLDKCLLI
jgi:hypothetical protein